MVAMLLIYGLIIVAIPTGVGWIVAKLSKKLWIGWAVGVTLFYILGKFLLDVISSC